jgi:hypothetical protein
MDIFKNRSNLWQNIFRGKQKAQPCRIIYSINWHRIKNKEWLFSLNFYESKTCEFTGFTVASKFYKRNFLNNCKDGASHRSVYVFFFCKRRSVTSYRPLSGSPHPGVCPTGGNFAVCLSKLFWEKIGNVKNFPVLIVHGKQDQVVPFSHGEELYNIINAIPESDVTFFFFYLFFFFLLLKARYLKFLIN